MHELDRRSMLKVVAALSLGPYSALADEKESTLHFVEAGILLTALKVNGRFYVLIAYEGTEPKLRSQFPLENWFGESLEVAEPSPLWVQKPKARSR